MAGSIENLLCQHTRSLSGLTLQSRSNSFEQRLIVKRFCQELHCSRSQCLRENSGQRRRSRNHDSQYEADLAYDYFELRSAANAPGRIATVAG